MKGEEIVRKNREWIGLLATLNSLDYTNSRVCPLSIVKMNIEELFLTQSIPKSKAKSRWFGPLATPSNCDRMKSHAHPIPIAKMNDEK